MFFFYKIFNEMAPQLLGNYLPAQNAALVNLRVRPSIYPLETRTERYRNSFFPYSILQWNSLDSHIRDLPSISSFKRAIFAFLRPETSPTFGSTKLSGHCLSLRVGFSHLREQKFRYGFLDTIDPFCNCRTNSIETTEHFLLHCCLTIFTV